MGFSTDGPRLLVSLATYNERDNLSALIRDIHTFAPQADVLVIDDNSPDGTGKLADELAALDPRIHVLHRPGKQGLGTALLAAMNYALTHGYDLMANMDADFSHHPRYLPALLAGMDRHDVMIGSRYIPGGGTVNWPLSRKFLSGGVNILVRLLGLEGAFHGIQILDGHTRRDGHASGARNTTDPSTRTSRMLSAPASVNIE